MRVLIITVIIDVMTAAKKRAMTVTMATSVTAAITGKRKVVITA